MALELTQDFFQYALRTGENLSGTQGSISIWFNAIDMAAASGRMIIFHSGLITTNYVRIFTAGTISDTQYIRLEFRRSSGSPLIVRIRMNVELTDTLWHHIVFTSDGSVYKAYLDGVDVGWIFEAGSLNGLWFDYTIIGYRPDRIGIGASVSTSTTYGINGKVFDARLYNRAISDIEVLEIYNGLGTDTVTSGLLFKVKMDEKGDGEIADGDDSLLDESGNNRHFTPYNEPIYRNNPVLPTCPDPLVEPENDSLKYFPNLLCTVTQLIGYPVYYTTNGSEPTILSNLYTAPFSVPASATIKVKSIRTGYASSNTITRGYIVVTQAPKPTTTLPEEEVVWFDSTKTFTFHLDTSVSDIAGYYTRNGEDPKTSLYAYPFSDGDTYSVGVTTHFRIITCHSSKEYWSDELEVRTCLPSATTGVLPIIFPKILIEKVDSKQRKLISAGGSFNPIVTNRFDFWEISEKVFTDILMPNPILWIDMDGYTSGGAGDFLVDKSGYNRIVRQLSTDYRVKDKKTCMYTLNHFNGLGAGESLSIGDQPFVISIWTFLETGDGRTNGVILATDDLTRRILLTDARLYTAEMYSGGSFQADIGANIYNRWVNIVFRYDGVTGYLYIDGVFKASMAMPLGSSFTGSWRIGSDGTNGFIGHIGNIQIWNQDLTEEQIEYIYARKQWPVPGLIKRLGYVETLEKEKIFDLSVFGEENFYIEVTPIDNFGQEKSDGQTYLYDQTPPLSGGQIEIDTGWQLVSIPIQFGYWDKITHALVHDEITPAKIKNYIVDQIEDLYGVGKIELFRTYIGGTNKNLTYYPGVTPESSENNFNLVYDDGGKIEPVGFWIKNISGTTLTITWGIPA